MNYRRILIAAVFILYIQWKKTIKNMTDGDTKLCQFDVTCVCNDPSLSHQETSFQMLHKFSA